LNLPAESFGLTTGSTCSPVKAIINSPQGVNVSRFHSDRIDDLRTRPYARLSGRQNAAWCELFSLQFKGVQRPGLREIPMPIHALYNTRGETQGVLVPGCSVGKNDLRTPSGRPGRWISLLGRSLPRQTRYLTSTAQAPCSILPSPLEAGAYTPGGDTASTAFKCVHAARNRDLTPPDGRAGARPRV